MIAEQWERIKDFFEEALSCSPEERQSLLTRLALEDPDGAAEVARLLQSFENAGDFLVQPCCPAPEFLEDLGSEQQRFFPGDVVCGRFRIVQLLGRGGMGEVYKAWDEEVEDHVALKTLRPEISAHELFTSRFRREIQLARKVTHPNVCRIFDSFKHPAGDGTYISVLSMELLQGQNLAEYLKAKGRLTAVEALPIAQQIIAGLSAIHAAGIIHRDLKPANLVLVANTDEKPLPPGFQLKITDFGIAGRLPEGLSPGAQTEASKLLGTPDYMAPEQMEGSRARIQSDIYSLGLILYEMVTGVKPFADLSPWKRISADSPSPRGVARDLPETWNRAIVCCLERNPTYRFESAQAALDILEGTASTAKFPRKPFIVRLRRAAQARAGWIAALLFLAMALSTSLFRYYHQRPEIPGGTTILVTDIGTSDPAFSGITVAFKSQLEQSAHLELERDDKITEVLTQMGRRAADAMNNKTAREVAWRSGVPLVIFGSLGTAKDGYLLSMRIERIKHNPLFPAPSWTMDFFAKDKTALFNAVHDASSWVRKLLGELDTELAQQDRPAQDTTTPSWQALQLYSRSEAKYSSRETDAAVLLLREAIQADPGFAKAHMRLADILVSLKRYKEGYVEWQKAIEITDSTQLTSREALRLRGLYYADTGSYHEAETAFREYTLHYPDDYLAWFYLGNALEDIGQLENAIDAFARAAELQPTSYGPHVHLALLSLYLGRWQDVTKEIEEVRVLGGHWRAQWLQVYAAFLNGDYGRAITESSLLFEVPSSSVEKSESYGVKASFLAEAGYWREAIATLQEGIQFDLQQGFNSAEANKLVALAYLYYRLHDFSESRTRALRAIEFEESPQRLLEAGTLLARARQLDAAQVCLKKARAQPNIPRVHMVIERIAGEILLAQNQARKSLVHFRKAAKLARANENQHSLGHALAVSGFEDDAISVFKDTIDKPAQLLLDRWNDWPGLWADSLLEFLSLQAARGEISCGLANKYLMLRHDAEAQIMNQENRNILNVIRTHCSSTSH